MFPFDDLHRYHRPAALVAHSAAGPGQTPDLLQKRIDWLAPDPATAHLSDADLSTFEAFGFTPPGKG